MTKKVSVSLPDSDIKYLESVASNRSAAVHIVIEQVRNAELINSYTDAFAEWQGSEDAKLWDSASGDGIDDSR